MKASPEKKEAAAILVLGLLLHVLADWLITNTYAYKTYGTYEGLGLIVGAFGLIIWVYGMVMYARTKGESDLVALFLSLFWVVGLIVLYLLPEPKSKKSKSSK
jgi:hypothetical protein